MRIKSIKRRRYSGIVYTMGVMDDESYCVEGIKVKNCRGEWIAIRTQDFTKVIKDPAKGIKTTPEELLKKGTLDIPASVKKNFDTVGGVPTMNKFQQLKAPINRGNKQATKVWADRD